MRIVAIIQARMGSTRLPGKILMPLGGQPVLAHVIARVRAAAVFDAIVVATTTDPRDDAAAALAQACGAQIVRGDEADVLARYGLAAHASAADAIMRITADCPLIDSAVLAAMVARFRDGGIDLITNSRDRSFPRGLDAELFSRAALEIMLEQAVDPEEREHVTPYLYRHPERFAIVDHYADQDHADWRLTLDTPEDYDLLSRIFADGAPRDYAAVIEILGAHPQWLAINAHVQQKIVGENLP